MPFPWLRQDVLQGRPSEVQRFLCEWPYTLDADVLLHRIQSPSSEPSVCTLLMRALPPHEIIQWRWLTRCACVHISDLMGFTDEAKTIYRCNRCTREFVRRTSAFSLTLPTGVLLPPHRRPPESIHPRHFHPMCPVPC